MNRENERSKINIKTRKGEKKTKRNIVEKNNENIINGRGTISKEKMFDEQLSRTEHIKIIIIKYDDISNIRQKIGIIIIICQQYLTLFYMFPFAVFQSVDSLIN